MVYYKVAKKPYEKPQIREASVGEQELMVLGSPTDKKFKPPKPPKPPKH